MFFRQFYDTSLAQASYMIGCQQTGEAIVVDPSRDVEPYTRAAAAEGLRIVRVTETHIHADFVSGCRELASLTGAGVLLSAEGGDEWQYGYAAADNATLLRHGDEFTVGNIRFDVLHTPGHTPEHLAFVVSDLPAGAGPMGILTGDFVFVGDVGRPDLLERAANHAGTMEASARLLYGSLQQFRALPDHLQLWPGHGAGSACGKALGAVPSSTVGYEKLANWALNTSDEAAFVEEVLRGQPDPPTYFARMKRLNRDGPRVLRGIAVPPRLPAASIHELVQRGAWVIDLRPAATVAGGSVPGTLNIPYNKSFSTWAGWLCPDDVELVLIVNADDGAHRPDELQQAVRDLACVGLDRVTGWMSQDVIRAWKDAGHEVAQVMPVTLSGLSEELSGLLEQPLGAQPPGAVPTPFVIDVRNIDEWNHGHIPGAHHIPLGHLSRAFETLPHAPIVVHCQSGGRSAIAASVLMRAGWSDVRNFEGGYAAWSANGKPVERG